MQSKENRKPGSNPNVKSFGKSKNTASHTQKKVYHGMNNSQKYANRISSYSGFQRKPDSLNQTGSSSKLKLLIPKGLHHFNLDQNLKGLSSLITNYIFRQKGHKLGANFIVMMAQMQH